MIAAAVQASAGEAPKRHYIGFFMSRHFWLGRRPESVPGVIDDAAIRTPFLARSREVGFAWNDAELEICVRRDGLVMLRVESLERGIADDRAADPSPSIDAMLSRWQEYLEHSTCLALILLSCGYRHTNIALFTLFPLTNRGVFRPTIDGAGRVEMGGTSLDGFSGIYHVAFDLMDPRVSAAQLFMAQQLDVSTVAEVGPQMAVVRVRPLLRRRLATLARALGEYQLGNASLAILLSWFVIEDIANERWMDWIEGKDTDLGGGRRRINADRRDKMKGRDYPASVVTNLLELADRLSLDQLKTIDTVRSWRNAIAHQEKKPLSSENAATAISAALELVREDCGFPLDLPLGLMVPVM